MNSCFRRSLFAPLTPALRVCVRTFFRPLRGLGLFHFAHPRLAPGATICRALRALRRRCSTLSSPIEFSRTQYALGYFLSPALRAGSFSVVPTGLRTELDRGPRTEVRGYSQLPLRGASVHERGVLRTNARKNASTHQCVEETKSMGKKPMLLHLAACGVSLDS